MFVRKTEEIRRGGILFDEDGRADAAEGKLFQKLRVDSMHTPQLLKLDFSTRRRGGEEGQVYNMVFNLTKNQLKGEKPSEIQRTYLT